MDLRCHGGKKFAEIVEPGVLEFKCDSPKCGAEPGVVIIHRVNVMTGEQLSTTRFKSAPTRRKKR